MATRSQRGSDRRLVLRSYVKSNYSTARNFGSDCPPAEWICADCGETSADAGRYRKAEPWEPQDEEGETYECSTCGCQMALPPPPQNSGLPEQPRDNA